MDRSHVQRNDASRERLRRLLDRLTDDDLGRPVGGWTIGVALLHLAFWDRFTQRRWEHVIAMGGTVPPSLGRPFADLVNDASVDAWSVVDPTDARRMVLAAADACDRCVADLPDALAEAALSSGMERAIDRSAHRATHLDPIAAELGLA